MPSGMQLANNIDTAGKEWYDIILLVVDAVRDYFVEKKTIVPIYKIIESENNAITEEPT
jgi:hypothetical protein